MFNSNQSTLQLLFFNESVTISKLDLSLTETTSPIASEYDGILHTARSTKYVSD